MSESIAQSYQECDERTGSIQSVWVTRWVGSGQNSTSQGFRAPNNLFESKKKIDEVELQSAGELRNIGSQTRQVVNHSFRAFSGNFKVESSHHSATMSMVSRNELPLRDCQEPRGCLSFKPHNDPNTTSATAISSGKNYSESEASLQNPIRRVKPHSFFRHSHTVASVPTVGNCIESVSHIVPYRFGYGKLKDDPTITEMPLLIDRVSKSHLPNSSRVLGDKHNHESQMESGRQSLKMNGDWFQKLQNGPRLVKFQNNDASLEATEPNKTLNNICMSEELPHSLHDMKTMRIRTTMDSVVGLKGCYPRFSQTTHSLLIMNESDVNICKKNQTVGTSRVCNEFNKRIFSSLDKLPSALSQKQQGVKLRLLDSCTASELEEDVGVVEPSEADAKNESSAETDAMDFDAFPGKTQLLGVSSSSLFKKLQECERGQKLFHLTPMGGVTSDGIKKNKTPNNIVNSYTLDIPAEASSSDNLELSSNTHSLDMESFIIAHNDQNSNSKPALFQSDLPGSDPSSRFVKRLKLSNLYNMALGTRSLNIKEDSSHEYKQQHTGFHGKACSEPTSNKNKGKEWMVQDKCTTRNNVGESSSAAENLKSCRDKLTSYPWIQRLLRDRATKSLQVPEVVGGYEPGSACLEAEQIQKRHFPSIAAMALMGKGMKGFQPCQFQNKGSFVVWN
ncbi:unnamed protein product [Cuscuta campestris]|uniref:Uncharacterized protein n=1 Tax=Cuscuta campestris TaxID=132261 RepID=A0A484KQ52_9ASTE|nr:unnamed protein product [Cuscuta campestris]